MRRCRFGIQLFFAFVLLSKSLEPPLNATERTIWWLDQRAALEQAKADNKLIMIVQGPDDFTQQGQTSRTADAYASIAIADTRLADFLIFAWWRRISPQADRRGRT